MKERGIKETSPQLPWICTFPNCDWTKPGKLALFEVIEDFADHNKLEHGSTISAELQRSKDPIPLKPRK